MICPIPQRFLGNFSAPDSGVGDAAEGQVFSTSVDNCELQLALRYSF